MHLGKRDLGSSGCAWRTGKAALPTVLGYEKGEGGKLAVNHEQPKVIQLISGDFISELSCHAIAENVDGHHAASRVRQVEPDHGALHPDEREVQGG